MASRSWHNSLTQSGDGPSPLELLFDLCYVAAVAAVSTSLHDRLVHGELAGLATFAMTFFAVWWSWSAYSWFASAYDSGDATFRLGTLAAMVGALVLAAGVTRAVRDDDVWLLLAGYVLARLCVAALWWRAGRGDASRRADARVQVGGTVALQALWVLWAAGVAHGLPAPVLVGGFVLLAVGELAVPPIARLTGRGTPWEPEHITERHGLFTIIVLGEVLVATSHGISAALDGGGSTGRLLAAAAGALLLVFGLWWLYFRRALDLSLVAGSSYAFSYLHYLVLGAAAALGGLVEAVVASPSGVHGLGGRSTDLVIAGAVACFVLALSALHAAADRSVAGMVPPAVGCVLLAVVGAFGPEPPVQLLVAAGVVGLGLLHHQLSSGDSPVRPATRAPEGRRTAEADTP